MVLRSLAAFSLAVTFLGCSPSDQDETAPKPNLLLITIDTLRPDHMSLYGYERSTTPELDRWFGDARIYHHAYTTEANTSPSIVSILTGLLPQRHRVRLLFQRLPASVPILSDYLRDAGYVTAAVISNIVLTDEAIGMASRFDHYDDFVDEREANRAASSNAGQSRTTDAALRWLARSAIPERPLFLWVHYIDPHGPYDAPPETPQRFNHTGRVEVSPRMIQGAHLRGGVTDALAYIDRYDEEIAFVDAEIGRLLEGYERLGFGNEAYTVLAADHGETMIEFDRWFSHGFHVYEPIIRVPLAIRGPGIEGESEFARVSLVSITPTLLDLAGVEIPPDLDGESLRHGAPAGPIFAEASFAKHHWRAAIQGDAKYVVQISREGEIEAKNSFLIAHESEDVNRPWNETGEPGRRLLELIADDPDPGGIPANLVRGMRIDSPKVAPGVSPAMRERLKALGYVDEKDPGRAP